MAVVGRGTLLLVDDDDAVGDDDVLLCIVGAFSLASRCLTGSRWVNGWPVVPNFKFQQMMV